MKILYHLLYAFCRLWPLERGRDFIMRHTLNGPFGDFLAAIGPWICVRKGWRMKTNMGRDYTSLSLKLYGELEPATADFLIAHSRPGSVFLDIGANVGFFSLLLAHHIPRVRVIAFEPNPAVANLLADSIQGNRLQEVIELHQLAASDRAATIQFLVDQNNSGHSRLAADAVGDTMLVEAVVLDQWLPAHMGAASIAVVKIDVEGAELGVLRGMRALLLAHRPALVVEGYDEHLSEFGDSLVGLRQWLSEAGYREVRPWDGNLYLLPNASS